MNDTQNGIRIEVFNVKGLTKRLEAVHKNSKDTVVLGVFATWLRQKATDTRELLDETEEAPEGGNGRRGFGGVGLVINPMVKYTIVDRFSCKTVQYITVKLGGTSLTVT